MGRPAKAVEVKEEVAETLTVEMLEGLKAPVVEVKEAAVAPAAKGTSYSLTASFKTRTVEGDRINHKYQGVGKTLLEAIESVVGSDDDLVDEYNKPFPRGINCNILIKARTSAGYEYERNVAPHVAKDILENKNVALAARLLGV